ncbi:MAG: hypothetical protein ACFFCD_08015 [Promethearchaeota archaeon]
MLIKEILHKLAQIENTRLIGVNTTEKEIHVELIIPQVIEGVKENIPTKNRIVKEISRIIDEGSYKCSIKIKDGFVSINIPISKK